MNRMLEAYLDCALWTCDGEDDVMLSENYNRADFAPESLLKAAKDCQRFYAENEMLIEKSELSDLTVGHNFWLTRNDHGAGFWDMDLGAVGRALSEEARKFGPCYAYLGDDGKVYLS